MTGLRVGDRVAVDKFAGVVRFVNDNGSSVDIATDYGTGSELNIAYVPARLVTVVGRALKPGDQINTGDPEPAIGTVITIETVDGVHTYLRAAMDGPNWLRAEDGTFWRWSEVVLTGDLITARHTPPNR